MSSPQELFPHLASWVAQLDDTFPGAQVKPYFAHWEVLHLLSLAVLGGASILLNLRLIGLGLTEESPSEVRRAVLPWLNAGVAGVVITGILLGTANPERLYTSAVFTAKMLGLLAALVLTYGVALPTAKAEGQLTRSSVVPAVVGISIYGICLWTFAVAKVANPGLWHVVAAASLLVLLRTRGRVRVGYLLGLIALATAQFVLHHVVYSQTDFVHLDPANKIFLAVYLVWAAVAAVLQNAKSSEKTQYSFATQGLAYAAILVWVTTAAAGRWIAFA